VSTTPSVVDRLRARIGTPGPPTTAVVEAGHLKRFAEAIGDSYPRWLTEAPPTFLVALAPPMTHLPEAEEYGKGWLNGGNRFEYIEPVKVGDEITAIGKVVDVYEKAGSGGGLLFIIFETEYFNRHGRTVARLRGTAIRR
jgi:N-terminal half of MaoC dehydratase